MHPKRQTPSGCIFLSKDFLSVIQKHPDEAISVGVFGIFKNLFYFFSANFFTYLLRSKSFTGDLPWNSISPHAARTNALTEQPSME